MPAGRDEALPRGGAVPRLLLFAFSLGGIVTMYKSFVRVVAAVLFSWLLVVAPAFADLTGDLSGTVIDSTGATVSAAKVTVQNLNTGQSRVLTTSEAGEFSAPHIDTRS